MQKVQGRVLRWERCLEAHEEGKREEHLEGYLRYSYQEPKTEYTQSFNS